MLIKLLRIAILKNIRLLSPLEKARIYRASQTLTRAACNGGLGFFLLATLGLESALRFLLPGPPSLYLSLSILLLPFGRESVIFLSSRQQQRGLLSGRACPFHVAYLINNKVGANISTPIHSIRSWLLPPRRPSSHLFTNTFPANCSVAFWYTTKKLSSSLSRSPLLPTHGHGAIHARP